MGNVPAKEESSIYSDSGRKKSQGNAGTSVRDILSTNSLRQRLSSLSKKWINSGSASSKDQKIYDLIVDHNESVDGGYLAPYGTYTMAQDYSTEIVRRLIIERKLAPFFLPLQDFDESWSDTTLLSQLDELELHAPINNEIEETTILDPNSKNYQKHLAARNNAKQLLNRRIVLQNEAQIRFVREKKLASNNGFHKENIPSTDLLLRLYKTSKECPICFLYYPDCFNYSRCCFQPICSECFVQIKRLDPHPPHDETEGGAGSNGIPKDLISEPAICPYCAMPDFGVTYHPLKDVRTGIHGVAPLDYEWDTPINANVTASVNQKEDTTADPGKKKRRGSLPPDNGGVVTTDYIRPDWERKLNSARIKLARKSAAATAIHASSLLMNETGTGEHREVSPESNADLEQKMIEQALKLSLLEEEERQRRQ